jgi:hypothetical protein
VSGFPRHFDPKMLGETLKEVATDFIAGGQGDFISRWFHSSKDADFFVWYDSRKNIIKQQLTFYGQVVEWNVIEGLRTGVIVESESESHMNPSETIFFDQGVQSETVEQGMQLVRHISGLNDIEREQIVRCFRMREGSPVDGSRFAAGMERLIAQAPAPRRSARLGIWSWLKSFLRRR